MAVTDAKNHQAWAVTDAKNAQAWAAYELRVMTMTEVHSKSITDSQRLLDEVHSKSIAIANGSSTSTPLVLASRRPPTRRPLAQLNVLFKSASPSNVSRGRLHIANASLTRRLLVSDAPLRHGRRRPPESSSCGSAADASLSGSPARPHGDCSVRSHSLACNMSKNAVCTRLSLRRSNNRSLQRV